MSPLTANDNSVPQHQQEQCSSTGCDTVNGEVSQAGLPPPPPLIPLDATITLQDLMTLFPIDFDEIPGPSTGK